ncbi:MAG: NAD(P)H-binding protein [Anaerolineales bacterium]
MKILVTGATGYIASKLIPQLLDRGHSVRVVARKPHLLQPRSWSNQVEIIQADVMDFSSLLPALKDIHTAYYLIHNMSSGHGYTEIELHGARNFARAAAETGVQHIIYLGGLADPEQHIAPHMRSRIETGVTLRQGRIPVTEFRAGVIVGSGSISFEMIRFMTELFPIIPGPRMLKSKSQPIAVQNVVDYLLAALENPKGRGKVFEIGGPDISTYRELMLKYAKLRGYKRSFLLLPYVPIWFMAFGIDLMTPVPYPIAYALVGGLSGDSVVLHADAGETFPEVKLIDFDSAASEALMRLHPSNIERVWEDRKAGVKNLKHEGFFIYQKCVETKAALKDINFVLQNTMKKNEANLEKKLLLKTKSHLFFDEWMEWQFEPDGRTNLFTQTVYLAPHGPLGFLCWYGLKLIYVFKFKKLLHTIEKVHQKLSL